MARTEVIIASYNARPEYLRRAVESSLETGHVSRVIVVDDGSEPPAAEGLATLPDDRVLVLRQPNRGASAARNTGLDRAEAEYVVVLDADDELLPGIGDAIQAADRTGAALVVSARVNFGADGREQFKPVPPEWADRSLPKPSDVFRPIVLFSTSGALIRGDVVRAGVRFDPAQMHSEDRVFFRRVADHGPIFVNSSAASRYRQHTDGTNLSAHLDSRIEALLRMLDDVYEPEAEDHWRAQTIWMARQYAKVGSDQARWARLVNECNRRGWRLPLKARIRFSRRMRRASAD